ncbi:zf-TFIIB domain-containing protein [Methyloprofundus sp.]|uniref:zf-TFIIB domain-containing protein n=1 Tax=Methyloprofundus sp. TaxID=2020875 RepID=UPI003D0E8540
MATCKSCSAPLLANTNRCQYCGVRNDVDLHAKQNYTVFQQVSDKTCPHCDKSLQSIQIQLPQPVIIERCDSCFGLFFDLGELDILLDYSVSHVKTINRKHIDNINTDRYPQTS